MPMANNSILRLGVKYYPFMLEKCVVNTLTLDPNPKLCPAHGPGFAVEIWKSFLREKNITNYELVNMESESWGRLTSNGWQGLLGNISNNTINTVIASYAMTREKMDSFLPSHPLYFDRIAFIYTRRDVLDRSALFAVFTSRLWFTVLAIFMLFTIVFTILDVTGKSSNANTTWTSWSIYGRSVVYGIWESLEQIFGQGSPMTTKPTQNPYSIGMCSVMIGGMSIFVLGLYQNCILSYIMRQPLKRTPFSGTCTLARFIRENKWTLVVTDPDEIYYQHIMHSNYNCFQRMRQSVESNEIVVIKQSGKYREDIVDKLLDVRTSNNVFVTGSRYLTYSILAMNCNLQVSYDEDSPPQNGILLMNKNSHIIAKSLNQWILDNYDHQIPFITKRYRISSNECTKPMIGSGSPLGINSLAGSGILLASGLLSATLVICIEYSTRLMKSTTSRSISTKNIANNQANINIALSGGYFRKVQH